MQASRIAILGFGSLVTGITLFSGLTVPGLGSIDAFADDSSMSSLVPGSSSAMSGMSSTNSSSSWTNSGLCESEYNALVSVMAATVDTYENAATVSNELWEDTGDLSGQLADTDDNFTALAAAETESEFTTAWPSFESEMEATIDDGNVFTGELESFIDNEPAHYADMDDVTEATDALADCLENLQ